MENVTSTIEEFDTSRVFFPASWINDMTQKNILIIEDESIIALELSLKLEANGFAVIGIANSEERAVKLAQTHKPDLVLSEIILHGSMAGVAAVEKIQKKTKAPVIYITSNKYLENENCLIKTHPCAVIGKPFSDEELFNEINKVFSRTGKN